jgi:hypothetical protein
MINYADYAFYTDTYEGAVIDTASFNYYARGATMIIGIHTFNRVANDNIPEEVKMCCCELAETLFKADKEDTKGIASEKVGEYSVNYVDSEKANVTKSNAINSVINNWLLMTGLLYRGC